jgi:hypothetical protein
MCDKSPFSASFEFITRMLTCLALGQLCIFKVVSTTCKSLDKCQFSGILDLGVSLWT